MTDNKIAKLAHQQETYLTIRDFMRKNEKEVKAVAAAHLNPERVVSLVLSHTRRSDLLLQCTPESLLDCVLRCARLGIEPTGAAGGMYIVPFKSRKKVGNEWKSVYIATPITDYRAEIDLAARTGLCEAVEPRIVYDGDLFEHEEGSTPLLKHKPGVNYQTQGAEFAVYARALLPSGRYSFETLYKGEIERRRKLSRSGDVQGAPWSEHYWRMALKSSVRAICNRLPKSTRFYMDKLAQDWVSHQVQEQAAEFGTEEPIAIELDDAALPESSTDKLAAKLERKTSVDRSQEDWEREQARKADEEIR